MKFLIGLLVSSVLTVAAFAAELNAKVEARVSEILSKMSLDEKLDYIGGVIRVLTSCRYRASASPNW